MKLYGIPCGIIHRITTEHDGSAWSFYVFAHVEFHVKSSVEFS